ncbi:hypothetical protein [Leptospira noguchii]|uniref:hypothetical protein n=1 Tax=Leptospira noguchii TaxID=28182 RepID=UPI003D73A7CE
MTFLAAIHNPDSNDLPGISELRKQLRNVDPVKGFTKEQMKTVSSWVNTNGLRMMEFKPEQEWAEVRSRRI